MLHLNGVTQPQLQQIKQALLQLIEKKLAAQQFGFYGSAQGLQIIAPLGLEKPQLKAAISNLKISPIIRNPVNDLNEVIGITGGSAAERKVVYWLSTGVSLTASQINQIKKKLNQEKVRLVILQLTLSELAINSFPQLNQLALQANGLFSSHQLNDWQAAIPNLAHYSLNGATLTLDSAELCGNVSLVFSARFADIEAKTNVPLRFSDCPSATQARVETSPPVINQTEPETRSELEEQNTETEEASAPPVEVEVEVDAETSTDETTLNEQEQNTPITEPENTAPVTANNTTDKVKLTPVIIGSISLILLLVALLLKVIKNRKDKQIVTEPQKNIYGYLLIPVSEGSRRIDLIHVSSKIGRSQENDIVLNDDAVSGCHAQIKCERNGDIVLIDLNSSNGTRVNGNEIKQQILKPGDEIEFGSYRLQFGG